MKQPELLNIHLEHILLIMNIIALSPYKLYMQLFCLFPNMKKKIDPFDFESARYKMHALIP